MGAAVANDISVPEEQARKGRRGLALRAAVVGWLLGLATFWAVVQFTGGQYEYHLIQPGDNVVRMVNQEGWQPIPLHDTTYLRRVRFTWR